MRTTLLAAVGLLAACAGTPPELYVLTEPRGADAAGLETPGLERVGLATVSLPGYAQGDKIASLAADNQIFQDEDHRWAEPPEDGVSRILALSLEQRLAAAVVAAPFPRGLDPDIRIDVRFDRFVRTQPGGAEISGQYSVISGDGGEVLTVRRFEHQQTSPTAGYPGFMQALEAALAELSRGVAEAIVELN